MYLKIYSIASIKGTLVTSQVTSNEYISCTACMDVWNVDSMLGNLCCSHFDVFPKRCRIMNVWVDHFSSNIGIFISRSATPVFIFHNNVTATVGIDFFGEHQNLLFIKRLARTRMHALWSCRNYQRFSTFFKFIVFLTRWDYVCGIKPLGKIPENQTLVNCHSISFWISQNLYPAESCFNGSLVI